MNGILLIVDDDPNILTILNLLFQKKKCITLSASSGQEALEILKNHTVHVLLVDQKMPEMIGTELLKIVKKRYPNIISILLSAYADLNAIQVALNEGGIFKFVSKPWDNRELLKYVAEAFLLYSNKNKSKTTPAKGKEKKELINNSLYKDIVTGLNNRHYFMQKIVKVVTEKKRHFAIFFVDIDHFSGINTSFGHIIGDMVLQEFGMRFTDWLKNDSELARLGNDDFALIVYFQAPFEIETIIHSLLKTIRKPLVLFEHTIHVSASIGISLYPDHTKQPYELIHMAQLAMQHSKDNLGGDNYQLYYPLLSNMVAEDRALGEALHLALERNEFIVYYQPVIDVKTKKIMGAEALVRWQNPNKGLVYPDQFIPLCEKIGLIIPLGAYVLNEACRQASQWHALGFSDLTIAVNLSARQFNHVNLKELIIGILEKFNFPPQCFNFEITETVLLQDDGTLISLLDWFDTLGLYLSLDDFGTGYSSLTYLQRFPFKNIKIDKTFTDQIDKSNLGLSLVKTIIGLGKSLGLTVIAEGVETEKQYDLLKKLNCDLLQGYLFSKPIPGEAFEKLLIENHHLHK